MIDPSDFIKVMHKAGYCFCTGVPCSFMGSMIRSLLKSKEIRYVGAASEGEAIGIGCGLHLGGAKSFVIAQNSGLGNMVNPLTSLNQPFRIPQLLFVSRRGEPGIPDEPQHRFMGAALEELLYVLDIPFMPMPDMIADFEEELKKAEQSLETRSLPFAFIVRKKTFSPSHDKRPQCYNTGVRVGINVDGEFNMCSSDRLSRESVIAMVKKYIGNDAAFIASTGKMGRELFESGHCDNQLYMVGSMGCASAIGLGVHLARPDRRVIILDGDGAVLMKMGALATIGHFADHHVWHIILDNESHESTGRQPTGSSHVDFGLIASACGYQSVFRADTEKGIINALNHAEHQPGPVCIHIKVSALSRSDLGRPTVSPEDVKRHFVEYLAS